MAHPRRRLRLQYAPRTRPRGPPRSPLSHSESKEEEEEEEEEDVARGAAAAEAFPQLDARSSIRSETMERCRDDSAGSLASCAKRAKYVLMCDLYIFKPASSCAPTVVISLHIASTLSVGRLPEVAQQLLNARVHDPAVRRVAQQLDLVQLA